MTYTTVTRAKGRICHGNLSCCRSRWSWMSTQAHEYIGLSPVTTRGSVPFEGNHYMHIYVCRWCVHACLNTHFTTLLWRVRRKSYSPHTGRDRFMTCRCTSHFDSMGGIHATHACVCAQTVSCVSSQSITYIYRITSKNNNPLLSQINLSCCQAKRSDGPSGPTDGKHRYRW